MAAQVLSIQKPQAQNQVVTYTLTDEKQIQFAFSVQDGEFDVEDQNLVFVFGSGEKVVIQDFYSKYTGENLNDLPQLGMEDMPTVDGQTFLAALGDDFVPAGGPSAAQHTNRYTNFDNLDLLDGVNHLRELDWGMQSEVAFDEPRVTQGVDDEGYAVAANAGVVAPEGPVEEVTALEAPVAPTAPLAAPERPIVSETPNPQPQPDPLPEPEPQPEQAPGIQPEPENVTQPEIVPGPQPESEPEAQPEEETEPEAKPEIQPESAPEGQPEQESQLEGAPQPERQPEADETEPEAKPSPSVITSQPFVTYDQALTGDDQWSGSYNFYIRDLPEGYELGEGADASLATLNAGQSTGHFEWVKNEQGDVTGLKFTQTEVFQHDQGAMLKGTVGWTDSPDEKFPAIDAPEHAGDAGKVIQYNVLPLGNAFEGLPLVNTSTGAEARWMPEVRIADDIPAALDDHASVNEGETTSGNLLNFDEYGTDEQADKYSKDGGKEGTIVSKVTFEGTDYAVPAPVEGEEGTEYPSITIQGEYGTLTVQANGDYEYTSNKAIDTDVTDTFSYTIVDSDGSTATADLTVELANSTEQPVVDDPQMETDTSTLPDTTEDDAGETEPEAATDVLENGISSGNIVGGDGTDIIIGDSGSQPVEYVQNISLVVDTSSSMWTALPDGTTRLDATMETLRGMISDIAGKVSADESLTVNISLVEFSDVAQLHTFGENGAWLTINADNANDMVELFNAKLDAISTQFVFDGFPSVYNQYGEIPLDTVIDAINEHFDFANDSDQYLHISREEYLEVVSANQWTPLDEFNLVDHQTNYQVAFDEALAAFSNSPTTDGAVPSNSLYFMSDGSPNRFVPANAGPENGADLGIEDWGIIAMLDGGYDGPIQDPATNAVLYRGEAFPAIEDSIATLEGIYGQEFTAEQRELVEGKLEQFRAEFNKERAEGGNTFAEFSYVAGIKDGLESFIAENPRAYSDSFGELADMGVTVKAVAWAGNDADFNLAILNGFTEDEVALIDSQDGLGDFLDANEMITLNDGADIIDGGAGDDIIFGDQVSLVDEATGETLDGFEALKEQTGQETAGDVKDFLRDNIDEAEKIADGSERDTDQADEIHGGEGNDIIFGQGGDDKLYGDEGDDMLFGGSGNDFLDGGSGHDQLSGGAGNDIMMYHQGDSFDGGAGLDVMLVADGEGGTLDELLKSANDMDVEMFLSGSQDALNGLTDMKALEDLGIKMTDNGTVDVSGLGQGTDNGNFVTYEITTDQGHELQLNVAKAVVESDSQG